MEAPDPPDPSDQQDMLSSEAPVGLDITSIGLLIFFIALIGIVAALLLLPILAG